MREDGMLRAKKGELKDESKASEANPKGYASELDGVLLSHKELVIYE